MGKIKVGIIGCGNISNHHMIGYNNIPDEVEVAACCDINLERAKAYAEKYGIKEYYGSYDEMLEKADIDAVSVTVWNNIHKGATIAALKAGKHVLCEKPMALNEEEAKEMLAVAKEHPNQILMLGFVRRFGKNAQVMKDLINAGKFGEIYHVDTKYVRRVGNPGGWFADSKRSSGGPLIDLSVHMIDLGWYLMGKPNPSAIYGVTFDKIGARNNIKEFPRYRPEDYSDFNDVEDHCIATLKFDNGAVMTVEVSYSQHIKGDVVSLDVKGTKAGARVMPDMEIYSEECDYLTDTKIVYREDDIMVNGFQREIKHFIDCINGKATLINTPEDGVAMMKMLCGIYESAKTGHEVIL